MTHVNTLYAGKLLQELLLVGGWQNSADTIAEAFPHHKETLQLYELLETLDNLEVPYVSAQCLETQITPEECPALVFSSKGECYIALDFVGSKILVADLNDGRPVKRSPKRDACTVIHIEKFAFEPPKQSNLTVWETFQELRQMIPGLFFAATLTNLLGLMAPLLIMAVYDQVIPSGSVDLLLALAVGVCILAVSDFMFRSVRTKALAYVGQKGERALAVALFQKLMKLPLEQLQRSNVTQQIARFRQFESLRELFTGQVVTNLVDLPFALLFLAVLTYLAPSVGFLTFVLAIVLLAVEFTAQPFQQARDQRAAEAQSASALVIEDAVTHQRTLANLGMRARWLERCMPLADAAEVATARSRALRNLVHCISQSVVSIGTVGAIILSAHGAVSGSMSFGALIASIALVSKVLAPIQALQTSLGQLTVFRRSQKQADQVLALKEEMELGLRQSHQKTLSGSIALQGVSFRPDPTSPPLLSAVDFNCRPGELVVILGQDIASRASILDLMSGLTSPTGGAIEHDGIDIRQIPRDELRKSVTYATYTPQLFYGTVKQNFELASPAVTQVQIDQALDALGIKEKVERLPEGCETRLNAQVLSRVAEARLKSLALARSIARDSSIYLLSEPTDGLGEERRLKLKAWIEKQRGNKTIVLATADRSFIPMADRLIYLNGGRVVVNDTGAAAQKKVEAVIKALGA